MLTLQGNQGFDGLIYRLPVGFRYLRFLTNRVELLSAADCDTYRSIAMSQLEKAGIFIFNILSFENCYAYQ